MKPITFKEMNKTLTKPEHMTDEECKSLPVYTDEFQTVSCWKMSFRERIAAVLFGRVWLSVAGSKQPPVWLSCEKTVFMKEGK